MVRRQYGKHPDERGGAQVTERMKKHFELEAGSESSLYGFKLCWKPGGNYNDCRSIIP